MSHHRRQRRQRSQRGSGTRRPAAPAVGRGRRWFWVGVAGALLALASVAHIAGRSRWREAAVPPPAGPAGSAPNSPAAGATVPTPATAATVERDFLASAAGYDPAGGATSARRVTHSWELPAATELTTARQLESNSNIRRADYAGAEACKDCHTAKYDAWSRHSHRWMNAMATPATVKGDFQDRSIAYLGGSARFVTVDGEYRMRLARDGVQRTYRITRTLGSRFFQYYIGTLREGPEPAAHTARSVDHVLPFGYWLSEREWVPVVHVGGEPPDGQRSDPFARVSEDPYDQHCATCHTTRPFGDWMLTGTGMARMEEYTPRPVAFAAAGYLAESHPALLEMHRRTAQKDGGHAFRLQMNALPAVQHAVNLGISCEACHNGCQQHVAASDAASSRELPKFFPASPHLRPDGGDPDQIWGRQPHNSNFICARCHSGTRPTFANGISTWNSTEYSDAFLGYCYGKRRKPGETQPFLTCVHCHDPHRTIGQKWTVPPAEDDAKCLACHKQFEPPEALVQHTHHRAGSSGSRCMNCHMPKINEGLETTVRTHTIFSPSDPRPIEANQPNACNLCHLDKPIDWTTRYLSSWYKIRRRSYTPEKIAANYPDRTGPAGLGWLKSPHEPTRLVAVGALAESKATWALPQLIDMLDDPFLLNRQFTQKGLQDMLGVRLAGYGYRFYMTPAERRDPIARLRAELPKLVRPTPAHAGSEARRP